MARKYDCWNEVSIQALCTEIYSSRSNTTNEQTYVDDTDMTLEKTKIAILTPSTSRGCNYSDPGKIDLTERQCRSLYPKIRDEYEYTIYLGYDPNDAFYDREETERGLKKYLTRHYPRLHLQYLKIPGSYDTLAQKWNYLYERAYNDGMDYFYQLGDDVLILDEGWEDEFTGQLRRNNNFGVTGPIDINNLRLLTHSFVSRAHYEVFGYYYPPEFNAWYFDDWIEKIYSPQYRYWNNKKIQNRPKPPRYSPENYTLKQGDLEEHVETGRRKIADYLDQHPERKPDPPGDPVNMILVSVVMTTYNRADMLKESVESILGQTHSHLELLIIDDGSTDKTSQVVAEYTKRDSRVKYYRLSENIGVCRARMHGIKLAKGEYIALMDDDDISYPHRLDWQLRYLEEHRDIDACACLFHDGSRSHYFAPQALNPSANTINIYGTYSPCPFVLGSHSMFRKKALLACGYRDFFFEGIEDEDLTLRFQERYRVGMVYEYLYIYRWDIYHWGRDIYRWENRNRSHRSARKILLIVAAEVSACCRRLGLPDPIEKELPLAQIFSVVPDLPLQNRQNWRKNILSFITDGMCKKASAVDREHLLFLAGLLGRRSRIIVSFWLHTNNRQRLQMLPKLLSLKLHAKLCSIIWHKRIHPGLKLISARARSFVKS